MLLNVVSFNLEDGAKRYGVDKAASLISRSGAHVALLQETTTSVTQQIAGLLELYHVDFEESGTAILSRLPIEKLSRSDHHHGLARSGGIYYCVVHLSDYPYIPSEAVGIDYPEDCAEREDQACFHSSDATLLEERSATLRHDELLAIARTLTGLPVRARIIVGGDFNEPSHLDWSQNAVLRGEVPVAVNFPSSKMMERLGFKDAFREVNHPNILGYSWPDRTVEYRHRKDRIDFIWVKGIRAVRHCRVISTGGLSDHAMILAELTVT